MKNDEFPIAPGLRLLGHGRAPDGTYVAVLRIKVLGKWTRISLPFEQTITPKLIEGALARAGFVSPKGSEAARSLAKNVNNTGRIPVLTIANGNGWYDGHSAFVLGRQVLGRPKQPVVVLSSGQTAQGEGVLEVASAMGGSCRAWKKGTRSALRHSDYILTAVCLALASPMASQFSEIESGLIHFHGESSTGKTLLLSVAWSLFGPCSRELLPNWNTTATGFEEQLETCADLPFVCDELTFQKDAPNASQNLKAASYAISSNRGKSRSKRWRGGAISSVRRGKTFVLSNGEDSLATTRNTESRRLGEECRAIDVRVRTRSGVFRTLPTGKTFADLVQELQACCQANYGHAGRRFIKSLIKNRKDWPDQAAVAMKKFLKFAKVPDTRLDRRFAGRFALAYAAGLEARKCGILDLSAKRIARSIRRVLNASSRPSIDVSARAREVLVSLQARLNDRDNLSVWSSEAPSAQVEAADILLRRTRANGDVFMVSPAHLMALCGSKEIWRFIIDHLKRENHLLEGSAGVATRQVTVNNSRRRFICIKGTFVDDGR